MISRKIRYFTFFVFVAVLMLGNVFVHIAGMQLSESSLIYEREITQLKQANLELESEIVSQASLQSVAAFAMSEGYRSSGPAIRWMDPVIAAR